MKVPTHKIHVKNKLSTVIEESFTQSDKTSMKMVTPRNVFMDFSSEEKNFKPPDNSEVAEDLMKKKITGIRKSSSLKETLAHNSPAQKSNILREVNKNQKVAEKVGSKPKINICRRKKEEKLVKVQ